MQSQHVCAGVRADTLATVGSQICIGKLRVNEVLGELAVLVQESPGHPFPRQRTAYASSPCVLMSLNWTDMQDLRRSSVSIDIAVREAVQVTTIAA